MSDQCQGCGERGCHADGCEVARLEAEIEWLRAILRDFPTIAVSTPALIKRIKTEWLPLRARALEGDDE